MGANPSIDAFYPQNIRCMSVEAPTACEPQRGRAIIALRETLSYAGLHMEHYNPHSTIPNARSKKPRSVVPTVFAFFLAIMNSRPKKLLRRTCEHPEGCPSSAEGSSRGTGLPGMCKARFDIIAPPRTVKANTHKQQLSDLHYFLARVCTKKARVHTSNAVVYPSLFTITIHMCEYIFSMTPSGTSPGALHIHFSHRPNQAKYRPAGVSPSLEFTERSKFS